MIKGILVTGLLSAFILMVSCRQEASPINGCIEIDVENLPIIDIFATTGVPDSCEFIRLETNENCLIEYISEITITDSLVVVGESFLNRLHIFTRQGEHINTIKAGRGAKESSLFMLWYVDTIKDRISNLDVNTGKWIYYSFNGEFIEEVSMDSEVYNRVKPSRIADIYPLDSENYLAVYSDYDDVDYKFYLMSRKDMSIVDSFVEQRHWKYLDFQNSFVSISGGDRELTFSPLFDTVYMVGDNNQIKPCYVMNGPRKSLTNEVYAKLSPSVDIEKDPFIYLNLGYSFGIVSMYATTDYVCVYLYGKEQETYRVVINRNNNSATKQIFTPESNRGGYIPFMFNGVTKDGFVTTISPSDIVDNIDAPFVQKHAQLREICKSVNEDDNPIIGIYYIKK